MSICAYCSKEATLTKEHLWPASLHERLFEANKQTKSSFWLARLQRDIPSEPQIRDVCGTCNHGVLSMLDAYVGKLFDSTFVRLLKRHDDVLFEYDYHLLKRWLLKMSYNSARIHDSIDLAPLERVRPYILGDDLRLGRSVQLFVQLVYPQQVNERELDEQSADDRVMILEPTMHRAGHLMFRAHGIGEKILRAVHLRSYSFFLAFWPPGGGSAEQNDFASVFESYSRGIRLLRPSEAAIRLTCDGVGAWDSFNGARGNRFSFDAGA